MLAINYPEKYKDEASRVGKKFKYYKIEPFDPTPKKEEKKKEIKLGEGSGRISALNNWRQNPQQGHIGYRKLQEEVLGESFSDLIDSYLEELTNSGNISTPVESSE